MIAVSGINRAKIPGSFVVSAFAKTNGQTIHLGSQGVFNRWHAAECANCQTHLEVATFIDIPPAVTVRMAAPTGGTPAENLQAKRQLL